MQRIVFFFFLTSLTTGFSQLNFDKSNQLLWEITRKGIRQPSYIFGSIHLNNPEIFDLSDSTYYALRKAEYFVSEVAIQDLYLPLKQPLNKNLLIGANGRIYSNTLFSNKNAYGSIKGRPQFLDAYLYQVAINSGKKMVALETVEEQLNAVYNVIYSGFQADNSLSERELINIYLSGNLQTLQQAIFYGFKGSNGYSELIVNRNKKMLTTIDSVIRLGSSFITVGAGHLAGKYGLLSLLYQSGYSVRPVTTTHSINFQEEKSFFKENHSYLYQNPSLHFDIRFGMKPLETVSGTDIRLEHRDLGQGNIFLLEIEKLPSNGYTITNYITENFFQPVNATLQRPLLKDKADKAYEGIVSIEEYGLAWKRIVFHDGYLYKMTCSGSLPFLTSNRAQHFFNSLVFH